MTYDTGRFDFEGGSRKNRDADGGLAVSANTCGRDFPLSVLV